MTLLVAGVTAVILYFAERSLARSAEQELQQQFRGELSALRNVRALREAALLERCRALVRKPRIHAALEDGALELLYPSARDELRDVMAASTPGQEATAYALHAEFYRFLDRHGTVITPASADDGGLLPPLVMEQLTLNDVPKRQQFGYVQTTDRAGRVGLLEIIAMPIVSGETGQVIAALVLGFRPVGVDETAVANGSKRGIWLGGHLHLPALSPFEAWRVGDELTRALVDGSALEKGRVLELNGVPHQLFCKQLNPDSTYPPAYEVCLYPLTLLAERQQRLRWQIAGAGLLCILAGLVTSQLISRRLTQPVERLAVDSEHNLAGRARAEAALEATSEELQRAARFSADASHQLKTPVAVLRAGLETLQAREGLSGEMRQEVAALIHQTYRLSGVIDDLLLLSRMDAGQLKLKFVPLDFTQLIEAALDDLGAQTDGTGVIVEPHCVDPLWVAGDAHYLSLILQNLLENARKYNRAQGRIRLEAGRAQGRIRVVIANTGRGIPLAARLHIFERFHRGAMGENIPGYGLGLNLARELARLHQGDLRLVSSQDDWTEFELWLPEQAPPAAGTTP